MKPDRSRVNVTLYLPEPLLEEVRRLARQETRSLSGQLAYLVRIGLHTWNTHDGLDDSRMEETA